MSNESDRAAIYKQREAYNSSLKKGDLEGWLATLSHDCVFLPPSAPAVTGKDAVRRWAAETIFDPYHTELDFDFEELEFVGSSAFAWGRFEQTLAPKAGGETILLKGKFLDVFKRNEAGEWKLARCAFSPDHE